MKEPITIRKATHARVLARPWNTSPRTGKTISSTSDTFVPVVRLRIRLRIVETVFPLWYLRKGNRDLTPISRCRSWIGRLAFLDLARGHSPTDRRAPKKDDGRACLSRPGDRVLEEPDQQVERNDDRDNDQHLLGRTHPADQTTRPQRPAGAKRVSGSALRCRNSLSRLCSNHQPDGSQRHLHVVLGFVCLLAVGSLVNGQIGFALLWAAVAGIAAYFQFVRGKGPDSDQQPGWYPNPTNLTEERYWDGRRWTGRRPAGPDREAADKSP